MELMTKTQQKLARQATVFLNCGGRVVTAVIRMLLLSVAVVFESVSRVCLFLDTAIENDARETERAQKRNVAGMTLTAVPSGERISLEGAYTQHAQVLPRAVGGRQ